MYDKKQWARYHDNRLLELAMYQLSEGMTLPVADRDKLYEKFAEFKRLVQRGSFTIRQLEESVYGRFGIMPHSDDTHDFLKALERLAKKEIQHDKQEIPEQDVGQEE